MSAARAVKAAGATALRGGAFKPRTSPHSFQGLGHEGLDRLAVPEVQFCGRGAHQVLEPC